MTPPQVTVRLTALVGEGDVVGYPPLYTEMVHRAHAAGLGGATRVRALLDGAAELWQTCLLTVEDVAVVGPPGGNRPG